MTPEDPKRGGFVTGGQLRAHPDDVTAYLLPPGERWVRLADLPERQKNGAAAMTPEERARAAASLYHEDYLGDGGTVPPLEVIIADAIREAVNEALERAAKLADILYHAIDDEGAGVAQDLRDQIRALKHPD